MIEPLPASSLYSACDLQGLKGESTADIEPLADAIGQERVVKAIEFALSMRHQGFNLYVMGSSGLGRHTLVREMLAARARDGACDWCYVADFQQPQSPRYLMLPRGGAQRLRQDMARLIDDLRNALPATFGSEAFRSKADALNTAAASHEQPPSEPDASITAPADEQRHRQRRLHALEHETAAAVVGRLVDEVRQGYLDSNQVLSYLSQVQQDIVDNAELFRPGDRQDTEPASPLASAFNRYRVNVLVDNSDTRGAPVVFEDHPCCANLLGRVEHIAHMGALLTDFTLIRAGALHRANGGFLVLDADKVLASPGAWEGLKRALKARQLRIESAVQEPNPTGTVSLQPQPIPIDTKVVLIGGRLLYYLLQESDAEFASLFQVTADFAEELPRNRQNELRYARLIAGIQRREGLRHISRDALSHLIEHSARQAWSCEKLSLNLGGLLKLMQEADYQADSESSALTEVRHVQRAIQAQRERAGQLQEQLQEQVLKGIIKIDTGGIQLAQVNGLSLLQVGDYAFGTPVRISATARLGSGELIDIERESEQGDPLHSKGVLILSSFLGARYAKHQPLSIAASLVFEQSYEPVEGDSASAAELCALLSALGDIPIKQSFAVTGSINQHGQLQAVGGVCQKIEGFFDICKARGLSGAQGVIIPEANVNDLMLRRDLLQAVEEGRFKVYAASHVEQVMELLSDLPAGIANAEGIYPPGSINHLIQLRLAEWLTLRQHYAGQSRSES